MCVCETVCECVVVYVCYFSPPYNHKTHPAPTPTSTPTPSLAVFVPFTLCDNFTFENFLNANNVHGLVPSQNVIFLGVVSDLTECTELCQRTLSLSCQSCTWHHLSFPKPEYQGHCYAHNDTFWTPVPEQLIDSALRTNPPVRANCTSCVDCSGCNGQCINHTCVCRAPWTGSTCAQLAWANGPNGRARLAYTDNLWTWGASPIQDLSTSLYHLFSSRITNMCGILHYCSNSEVIHLTSSSPFGPFQLRDVALAPRPGSWDDGAIHGPTIHRLNNGTYVLFYTGTSLTGKHPNCTQHYDPNTGDHSTRRIGLAVSNSLDGPWKRFPTPSFGPCTSPGCWDTSDTSNPSPIIRANGSLVLLYKGRGKVQQLGIAWADSIDGVWERKMTPLPNVPQEDPWGYIDNETGIYHVLTHDGNGATSAGGHSFSVDEGRTWIQAPMAYTGSVIWTNGSSSVLARRERPQVLLSDPYGGSYGTPLVLYTSGQTCIPNEDFGSVCRSYSMVEGLDS
eukprot:m.77608 g.77608  ORF g.77608 m.77608 type:complete len:507 (+) comp20691_c0_seq1:12-1532(+)